MSEQTFTNPVPEDRIVEHYNASVDAEWNRLELDAYNRLEYTATMRVLRRYMPSAGTILDAGGGPGRYARELCRAGYQVVLHDLSSNLLEKARAVFAEEPAEVRARLLGSAQGDVRDLALFYEGQFEVTLCLGGPLSHLHTVEGRSQAMRELTRVTRPGGMVIVCVIGYLAALRTLLWKYGGKHFIDDAYMHRLLTEGNGGNWHFFRAAELRELAEHCGLETLNMIGCESLSTSLPEATNELAENPERWGKWDEILEQYADDPTVVDSSAHILYIGRKP